VTTTAALDAAPEPEPVTEKTIEAAILETLPWKFSCFGKASEIESFCIETQQWITVGTINSLNGIEAEDLAGFITQHINALQPDRLKIS
jgi:hypothetical protein